MLHEETIFTLNDITFTTIPDLYEDEGFAKYQGRVIGSWRYIDAPDVEKFVFKAVVTNMELVAVPRSADTEPSVRYHTGLCRLATQIQIGIKAGSIFTP